MNKQKKGRRRKKKKFGAMTCEEVLPEESHAKEKIGDSEASAEDTSPEQTKAPPKGDLKHASSEDTHAEELVVSDAKTGNHDQICCKRWMVTRGSLKRHDPRC